MVNRVVIVGRLTRDPELRTTATGKSVCGFSVAVTKRIKPQDGSADADFFSVTAWDKTADYVTTYLAKGRLVAVDGRLQQRRYTTKEGQEREIVEIVAESVQGLDRPREDGGGQTSGGGGGGSTSESRSAAPNPDEYDPFADE